MCLVSRPFERTLSWVELLTQSRQDSPTGSGCDGQASLGSLTRPCHLTTPWPVAWSIKGTQSIALNKRAKRSLVPLVPCAGMRPPKQSPLRPTKTGRWGQLNQRWKGSLASFAFGYSMGLFWASMTNRLLLVLSGSCPWFCDHKGPVDLTNVITKGNHRACHRPRRPVVFSCVYKAFVHGTLEKTGKWFVLAQLPPILTT